MGVVATFDISQWRIRYPEFSGISDQLVQAYAVEATLYHANDGSGPVGVVYQQQLFLDMVTAHIAQLNFPVTGAGSSSSGGGPQLTGMIQMAQEGTVTVEVATPSYPSGSNAQWWLTTKYGAAYWLATAKYRTMRYRPGFPRQMEPLYNRGGFGGWGRTN